MREVASGARFQFALNGVTKELEKFAEIGNVIQENALGEKVELSYDLPFIRDGAYASAVINDKLFFMQENRVSAQMNLTDPGQLRQLNVGSVVRLTHYAGLGAEGYRAALFRAVSVGIDLNPESFAVRLKLVDVLETVGGHTVSSSRTVIFDRVPNTYTTHCLQMIESFFRSLSRCKERRSKWQEQKVDHRVSYQRPTCQNLRTIPARRPSNPDSR